MPQPPGVVLNGADDPGPPEQQVHGRDRPNIPTQAETLAGSGFTWVVRAVGGSARCASSLGGSSHAESAMTCVIDRDSSAGSLGDLSNELERPMKAALLIRAGY